MSKALKFASLAVGSLVVVVAFFTAKTYVQLALACATYPIVAYFAYTVMSKANPQKHAEKTLAIGQPVKTSRTKDKEIVDEEVRVVDVDRRTFLKLIGATGLSFLVFSILGRRMESLIFNRNLTQGPMPIGDDGTTAMLPTDKYRISEIDDGETAYYGFTSTDGSWFIMKEDDSGSFRYTKGSSDFSGHWANRDQYNYDYYHKVF